MSDKAKVLVLHAGCIALIGACIALSLTVFAGQPVIAQALIAVVAWLWGKLAFKPSRAVLAQIIQALDLTDVVRLVSSHPPAQGQPTMTLTVTPSLPPPPAPPPPAGAA